MPLVGLLLGRDLSHALGGAANTVGGLLLIAVGSRVTISAARSADHSPPPAVGARMGNLLVLAAVLSIDNLVVGFALGAYRTPLLLSLTIIALVSVGLSLLGLELGARLGASVGHRSELLSGVVLIAVGLGILTNLL